MSVRKPSCVQGLGSSTRFPRLRRRAVDAIGRAERTRQERRPRRLRIRPHRPAGFFTPSTPYFVYRLARAAGRLASLAALIVLLAVLPAPVEAQTVSIASNYDTIGAGLEDLVFTLTREGATTAALDATVTITQEQEWLLTDRHCPNRLKPSGTTVTFAAGDAETKLTLLGRCFSFEPEVSGDLTATVGGAGVTGGSKTVSLVSTKEPPLTVRYEKAAYVFDEDEADTEIYGLVTLHEDYPRAPSRGVPVSFSSRADTAVSPEDYGAVSTMHNFVFGDFEDDGTNWVARKGIGFRVNNDHYHEEEASEKLTLIIERSPGLIDEASLIYPDGSECTANNCATPVTIIDDDLPEFSVSASPASIAEADDAATMGVAENASVVTVWSTNEKAFLDDRVVTLTFGGDAMKGTHYAVTPADTDGTEEGHQVVLIGFTLDPAEVKLTVTATANDIHDGPRTIEVDAFLDGESLGATQITINDDDRETVAPVFDEGTEIERRVAEDTPAGVGIGAPFMATDDDDDPLTYSLEGADAAFFDIGRTSGQLLTKVALDYETKVEHTLTVTVNDGYGGASSIDVKVLVTDVDEPPEAPSAPQVSPSRGDTTSLDVTWDEPNNKGPEIDDYDLRYRVEGTVGWTDGPQDVAIRSAMIANLIQDTVYEVQVRAWNEEGGGDWSPSGRGAPGDTMASGATLSDLKVEEYQADPEERPNVSALTPPFNPDVLSYRVLAGGGVPFLEVTAPTNAATATVTWSVPARIPTSTDRRRVVALDYGMNVIGVTVTAESGAARTYTVKVRRANGPIELAVGMGFVNSVFYLISGGVLVEESGRSVAQRFTTGRHPTGYALTQIMVKVEGGGDSVVSDFHARVDASIWSVDGDGDPGEELFDLRSTIVGDDKTVPLLLGPPEPQFLQSETEYFLVLKSKEEDFRVGKAPNRAEVSHDDGWDIANHFHTSSDGGSSWTARSDGESIALNIWGIRQPGSTAAQEAASPLTAEFGNVPASHDGETPFTVEIRFNETPHGTGGDLPGMTDETLQAIIGVTNGAVTSVARVNRNGAHRIVTIEPDGNGAVTVSLAPSTNCDEVESLCTEDGGSLETLLTIAVPGPDVTEGSVAEKGEKPL